MVGRRSQTLSSCCLEQGFGTSFVNADSVAVLVSETQLVLGQCVASICIFCKNSNGISHIGLNPEASKEADTFGKLS